ncbi:MAG: prolyl oligopeptidase family serine peptidase [Terriglobales bacterium]
MRYSAVLAVFWLMVLLFSLGTAQASPNVATYKGQFPDGATYLIEVPENWNGTLVLYSHGYVPAGSGNPAEDVGDPFTGSYLLSNGYALAGSSYASTGWAVQQALPDQIATLDAFNLLVGQPSQTIAWGHSMGGMITAGLVQQYPQRFDAALPMCGVLAGSVGLWNTYLDSALAFNTLLASGSGLQLVNITNPGGNLDIAESILQTAQGTPEGQARISLAAALADIPGWANPVSPEPPPGDYADQEVAQYIWLEQATFAFDFDFRAELEHRAGGNFSWTNDVDFSSQLQESVDYDEVSALYRKAGLNLNADLRALNAAARIEANPASLTYLSQNLIFNGEISTPILTLHTKADGLAGVENESAYDVTVSEEGNGKFLRQVFVDRADHCAFTPAETVAAFQALVNRLDTGAWSGLDPAEMNADAGNLGPGLNFLIINGAKLPVSPAYFDFAPAVFLRPFDSGN